MAENPQQYAKLANQGLLLGYPVRIDGQSNRPDNGVGYHSTIKYFDPSKDHPHAVHNIAQHLPLNPPDAKNTQVKFDKFKDRLGNDVHVITLHGNSSDKIKEHNGKFAHMGFPSTFKWEPHISVDKATWEQLQAKNPKTAHDAGIEFSSAELKKGPKTIKKYHHEPDSAEPKVPDQGDITAKLGKTENVTGEKPLMKPYVSEAQRRWAHTPSGKEALGGNAGVHEWDEATKGRHLPEKVGKNEHPLEKGTLRHAGIALGMAGALAGAVHHSSAGERSPASVQHASTPSYNHQKMLDTISQVESSGGKNTNHPAGGGPIHGSERAFGKYGLMPQTIRETIKGNKDLKSKYGRALALKGDVFHKYMSDNKGLEDQIADRHLSHLERHFGQDPDTLGYAWLEGIHGAHSAKEKGVDIKNHWHVKKIRNAYNGAK